MIGRRRSRIPHFLMSGNSMRRHPPSERHHGPLLAVLLPALALSPTAFSLAGGADVRWGPSLLSRALRLARFLALESFASFERWLSLAVATLFLTVAICALLRVRSWTSSQIALCSLPLVGALLYFGAPDEIGAGGFLLTRLSLYVYILSLMCLAAHAYERSTRLFIHVTSVTISLLFLVSHVGSYRAINQYLEEYIALARHVGPARTLLALTFIPHGPTTAGRPLSAHVGALEHAAAHIARIHGIVYLNNYEARSHAFPLAFHPRVNPYLHTNPRAGDTQIPRYLHPDRYEKRTGVRVDYIVVIGEVDWSSDEARSIARHLEVAYDLRAISTPLGIARLYRRVDEHARPSTIALSPS